MGVESSSEFEAFKAAQTFFQDYELLNPGITANFFYFIGTLHPLNVVPQILTSAGDLPRAGNKQTNMIYLRGDRYFGAIHPKNNPKQGIKRTEDDESPYLWLSYHPADHKRSKLGDDWALYKNEFLEAYPEYDKSGKLRDGSVNLITVLNKPIQARMLILKYFCPTSTT